MAARSRTAEWSRGSAGAPRRTVIRPGGLDGAACSGCHWHAAVAGEDGDGRVHVRHGEVVPTAAIDVAIGTSTSHDGIAARGFNRRSTRRLTALPCVLLMP
jgi:hypothetical protein